MDTDKLNFKNCFIFDFDSTIIKLESLDELIKNSCNSVEVDKNVEKITNLGMNGKISFQESLEKRIKIVNLRKSSLNFVIDLIKKNITDGFFDLISKLKKYGEIFIVSGGFFDLIFPVSEILKIKKENIFANDFIFDNSENIIGFDRSNKLSSNMGKVKVVEEIISKNNFQKIFMIGDGYTDLEVALNIKSLIFCGFGQNIKRENVIKNSNLFFNTTNELEDFFNKELKFK